MRSRLFPLLGLGLVGAAILAAIVSISVGREGPAPPVEGAQSVQRLYGGIEQQGDSLGSPDAPVTISIFNDLKCTDCGEYQLEVVPELVESLVRRDKARLELRHLSVSLSPTTRPALAATAAGKQGTQWQYAHLVYLNLDQVEVNVDDPFLERVAAAIPGPEFDEQRWSDDLGSADVEATVQSDADVARELGVPLAQKPAVFVDGPNGRRELKQSPSVDEIKAAVGEVRGG
jgi:protein-disulfide isomerase